MVAFRAMAVTIPGRAMGRTTRNESAFCPKKLNRDMANASSDPRTSATSVARKAALSERRNAARTSSSW